MLGVEQRLVDARGFSRLGMARVTGFLAHDYLAFVSLRHLSRPVQHKADQELVLFRDSKMMTLVTVERFVLALGPAVVGWLHQVAADAEFGIILSEIVEFVRYETAAENYYHDKRNDKQFRFQGNRLFQPVP
jgi:hypothetical protein